MTRTEIFVPHGHRILVAPADLVAAWRRYTQRIPAKYALGTAQHESSFTLNEVDTEKSGYVSKGVYQLSESEAAEAEFSHANLLELEDATRVFCVLCERRLQRIIKTARLAEENLPVDVWAYLALAHNQGLSAALKTIELHGLNWAAYKQRNPQLAGMGRYGDDVISGGSHWTKELDSAPRKAPQPRTLAA